MSATTTNGPRTKREAKAALGPYGKVGQTINEMDERFGIAKGSRTLLNKIFPDHWSFLLGEIAMYSFIILLATGVFLSLYFVPSTSTIIYHGAYAPLRGLRVSEAYASTVNISMSVRAGLLMRQMHHWAADIFVGAIVVHMARIFFTGGFRKPRETNWVIGTTMLILAILNGFIGYSLPDDLVSGTGLRIGYSIMLSIPLVGSYLASFLFGGTFPGTSPYIERFFLIHMLVIPAVIALLLGVHLGLMVRQKHTQFPGNGATEENVVGSPMFPTFIAKTTGFMFMITGVIALLGAFAQINPIWQFGSYEPYKITYAVQPDFYMGWLDGALRIMPSWEWSAYGHTLPWEVFFPAALLPGLVFNVCFAWPVIERFFTKDNAMHHILDRPRMRPKRTAFGAAFFAFVFMLFLASSTDVLANYFRVSLNLVLWFFRIAVLVAPPIVGFFTYRICLEMQGVEGIGKRKRAVVIRRTETGEYVSTPTAPRPGDGKVELPPEPIPARIEMEPAAVGARTGNGADDAGVRTVTR